MSNSEKKFVEMLNEYCENKILADAEFKQNAHYEEDWDIKGDRCYGGSWKGYDDKYERRYNHLKYKISELFGTVMTELIKKYYPDMKYKIEDLWINSLKLKENK